MMLGRGRLGLLGPRVWGSGHVGGFKVSGVV